MSEELYGPRPAQLLPVDTSKPCLQATVIVKAEDPEKLSEVIGAMVKILKSRWGVESFEVKYGGL